MTLTINRVTTNRNENFQHLDRENMKQLWS